MGQHTEPAVRLSKVTVHALSVLVKPRELEHADKTSTVLCILSTDEIGVVGFLQIALLRLHPGIEITAVVIPFDAHEKQIAKRLLHVFLILGVRFEQVLQR